MLKSSRERRHVQQWAAGRRARYVDPGSAILLTTAAREDNKQDEERKKWTPAKYDIMAPCSSNKETDNTRMSRSRSTRQH